MNKKVEFQYRNEDERTFEELTKVRYLLDTYLTEIKEQDRIVNRKDIGELFGYDIAFRLEKEIIPPIGSDEIGIIKNWSERIELKPIEIKRTELKIPINYYQPIHKYSLKERLKVLFKGHI